MISNTTQEIQINQNVEPHNAEDVFYLSAEFWVAVTFVLVVAYLIRPAIRIIKKLIQKRIERIKQEINDAENIKLEAQQLYADTERSLLNIDKEIEDITNNKKYLISQTKERRISNLNYNLQAKEAELNAKIEQTHEQMLKEINEAVCQKTIKTLSEVISAKLTKKEYSTLIDDSIENIKNMRIGD